MSLIRIVVPLVSLFAVSASPLIPQVEVSEAPKQSTDIAAPCPMQLDISLGGDAQKKRVAFADTPVKADWITAETAPYVCRTARIASVSLRRLKERQGSVRILIQPTVMSEAWRQDVDLTVSLIAPDGKEYCRSQQENLTVGKDRAVSQITWVTMASRTKRPIFECSLRTPVYDRLFTTEAPPVLRIILDPESDEDSED